MKTIHYNLNIRTANQNAIPEKDRFNDDDVLDQIIEDLLEMEIHLNNKYAGKIRVYLGECKK